MAGLTQILNTGATGLEAATAAMQTVSNNTANVNTPGYSVESVAQSQLPGVGNNPGSGTEITSIQRGFNQFVFQQVVQATSANQAAQIVQSNSQALASIFPVASGGAGGLGAALGAFFAAASTLTQDPTSVPNRETFLSQAQSLAGAFHSAASQVTSNLAGVDGQLTSAVQQINSLTQQIAAINQQIGQQSANSSPNALLDQRGQLVQQLGQELGVTVLQGNNGAVDVYTSGGAVLVHGAYSYQLSAAAGGFGDGTVAITYGPTGQDLTNSFSSGSLGGLLASQRQLVGAQDGIGGLAASLAAAVNTQQSLGLDLNGNLGQALFSVAGPTVYPSSGNAGSGTLTASITDTSQFTPGDFILTKTASGFEATNAATGQTTALGNGPTLTFDGLTVTVSGAVSTGDSFKLEPTAAAAQSLAVATGDPTAIAAAAAYVVTAGAVGANGAVSNTNLGNVTASIGGPSSTLPAGAVSVPASSFGQPLSIVFTSATNFNVQTSGGTILASGSVSANAGVEIGIGFPSPPAPAGEIATVSLSAGTAAAGDTFTLTPGSTGSNGNIAALAGLASQKLLSGQTLGDAYASLVTTVGNRGQEAQVAATAAQAVLTQAQQTQQSISGVNLDEEAAHLVAYQQAYQASAQVIASTQTLFQALLTAVQAG